MAATEGALYRGREARGKKRECEKEKHTRQRQVGGGWGAARRESFI